MTGTGGVTRWRKRPVTMEAVRWTGDNAEELAAFTGSRFGIVDPEDRTDAPELTGQVFDVLHSTWVGMSTGQWVIKGVRGEFYPCDDAVLAETYDPAGEDDGAACRTVTREALAGALAALPLGEFLTPDARDRFADALLAQMPVASPLVTEDQAREIMQQQVEAQKPRLLAEVAAATDERLEESMARVRVGIAAAIAAEKIPCREHPMPFPKPSCWQCGRNGAFNRAALIAAGKYGTEGEQP